MVQALCRRGIILVALLAALLVAIPASSREAAPDRGKQLFDADCAVCHRADGSGGIAYGPTHSADLRAPGLETLYRHQDALMLRAILEAKDQDGKPLDKPMPAWRDRLTRRQAAAILAYLKTLRS